VTLKAPRRLPVATQMPPRHLDGTLMQRGKKPGAPREHLGATQMPPHSDATQLFPPGIFPTLNPKPYAVSGCPGGIWVRALP